MPQQPAPAAEGAGTESSAEPKAKAAKKPAAKKKSPAKAASKKKSRKELALCGDQPNPSRWFRRFLNTVKIPELRRRILFTLAVIVIVRLGAAITTPGREPGGDSGMVPHCA